ncbi:MAG: methylthioribulose 1-phosphate dehydratase [Alphaproteobacteria bacterium]
MTQNPRRTGGRTLDPRDTLIAHAGIFYGRGWMAGTAGNLSARSRDGVWITASAKNKGALEPADFVHLSPAGELLEKGGPESRPSAESGIHLAIYRRFAEAKACYHVHTVESTLASRMGTADWLPLPGLEMLKGFGLAPSDLPVAIPVFDNHDSVDEIGDEIARRLEDEPPAAPVLLIRNHGLTTWGESMEAAFNHVELAEYVFRYMVAARLLRL